MKNNAINVLIISTDTRLEQILQSNESEKDQLNIRLHRSLINLRLLPKSDAYIFDVELTSDNPISAVTKIYKLKKEIGDNPLILIGKKEAIDKVQHNEMIQGMVDRTINKPISYSQIQLAVDSSLSLSKSFPPIEPDELKGNSNSRRYVVASLLAAFLLISVITFFQTNETPLSQSKNIVNENNSLPDSINSDQNTQPIDKLNKAALLAVNEGRLSEPENNNAIYFLKQIKQLDPYNNTANQTHRELFQLLEASYLDHASKNNYLETRKALKTILYYEPYNHKYAVLLRQLEEQNYLAKQKKLSTSIESINSIAPVIEEKIETDNDKSATPTNANSIAIPSNEKRTEKAI